MIVQIYEVGSADEAQKLVAVGVDNIGVLTGIGNCPTELSYEKARALVESLPENVIGVALSLSADPEQIMDVITKVRPRILHLGVMPQALTSLDSIKIKLKFPHIKIMRTIPVVGQESVALAKEYESVADYLLLDTYNKESLQLGVTGKTHDWDVSRAIVESVKIPVILAGGLGPENVVEAIAKVKPAGVDSKTKTDALGGGKDIEKVREFVRRAKEAA